MSPGSINLSLADLAKQSGVPGRTIRFYIARGVLPGPAKAGRGASYGGEHLERLAEIERLQAKGMTLREIARHLSEPGEAGRNLEAVACWEYRIAQDVVVQVRGDASPWRLKQIRKELERMAAALQAPG